MEKNNNIPTVAQVTQMDIKQMEKAARDIRTALVSSVLQTGGHLASNLGVVELTLAVHKVFDVPKDKIIWDVGHQAYVHKMITGRAGQMDTLRKEGGISGFPKREESMYDVFNTGHSSTSISAALGIARARDLKGDDYNVVAVIGDGALGGGLAFEALNDAGRAQSNLIVILNDNGMSIGKNVGAMAMYLSKVRASKRYLGFKSAVKTILTNLFGNNVSRRVERWKDAVRQFFLQGDFFETMGFFYIGPVDGHDLKKLCTVLERAKQIKAPCFVHVTTTKGKGYVAAENAPEQYHGVAPFYVGNNSHAPGNRNASAVFGEQLVRMAQKDESIVAITAAMGDSVGLKQFAQRFPERFFDVGIAEEHALTMAAGMASAGLRPFCAIYSTFLQRAYDEMLHDICLQNLPVTICVDRSGLVGEDGATHQGVYDISYLRTMPNMHIFSPASYDELEKTMVYCRNLEAPAAIRYARGALPKQLAVPCPEYDTAAWYAVKPGKDGTILAVGRMLQAALQAAQLLENTLDIAVVNARVIKPLDEGMLQTLTSPIITLEENVTPGGFGSAVAEFYGGAQRLLILGLPEAPMEHATVLQQLQQAALTPQHIADRITQFILHK